MKIKLSLLLFVLVMSCKNRVDLLPKPRAYPKVTYPVKSYETFVAESCPFEFLKPTYASMVKDSSRRLQEDLHPCWFDLFFEDFNGSIHCSYIPITPSNTLEDLISESFRVVDQVNKRSNYVEETVIAKEDVGGIYFSFEGPAASQAQFFLTDSSEHFFKGSLYFNAKVRPDSIAPIAAFIQEDIQKLIDSFNWQVP